VVWALARRACGLMFGWFFIVVLRLNVSRCRSAVLFKRRCSAERCLSLFGLGLTDFVVVLNPWGICWLLTGYMFSSTHFFRRESLLALLSVKRAAFYVAFEMVRCNVYVLCWCVFPHPLSFSCLWQGVETRFSLLNMQFRARHSRANNSPCYTSFVHMPEMYLAS